MSGYSIQSNSEQTLPVAKGAVSGLTAFSKFGRNESVGTTLEPLAAGGIYQTPTALTSIEVLSSSSSDTFSGVGARTLYIEGIGSGYGVVSEIINMNGTTAVALSNQYYRIYRAYVVTSGTYASSVASSHVGTITLRTSGGGSTWATIGLIDGLGRGQTQIAAYTVPVNKTLYVYEIDFSIETGKGVSILLFQRNNIDTISAPMGTMRVVREYTLAQGTHHINLRYPLVFNEKTDVGIMCEVASGAASLSCQFDGVLENNI